MSQKPSIAAALQRLSPRERLLGGIALALVLVIGLTYGGLMPGMTAARSAATRNADAAATFSAIRALATPDNLVAPGAADASALRLSAETAGLQVSGQEQVDGRLTMTIVAPGPQAILSWLAANSGAAAIESFVIEPAGGGVTGRIQFVGGVS